MNTRLNSVIVSVGLSIFVACGGESDGGTGGGGGSSAGGSAGSGAEGGSSGAGAIAGNGGSGGSITTGGSGGGSSGNSGSSGDAGSSGSGGSTAGSAGSGGGTGGTAGSSGSSGAGNAGNAGAGGAGAVAGSAGSAAGGSAGSAGSGGVPANWACDPSWYGESASGATEQFCDCNCVAWDIDCDVAGIGISGCNSGETCTNNNGTAQCSGGSGGSAGAGGTGGTGGSSGSSGSAGSGGAGDELAQARQYCVDKINQYRATLNLPAYQRWSSSETCADGEAQSDYTTQQPHGAFGTCGEWAQNECPGWSGPFIDILDGCLAQMWAEGPGADFNTHGHYINMSSNQYTQVACGFYRGANGEVWALQNFQ